MEIKQDYDEEDDILYLNWATKECGVDFSEEIISKEGHVLIIDYDLKGRIVGLEVFDWNKGKI